MKLSTFAKAQMAQWRLQGAREVRAFPFSDPPGSTLLVAKSDRDGVIRVCVLLDEQERTVLRQWSTVATAPADPIVAGLARQIADCENVAALEPILDFGAQGALMMQTPRVGTDPPIGSWHLPDEPTLLLLNPAAVRTPRLEAYNNG